jgi:hypothetical protein
MSTRQATKHFDGFARSGHATPPQFRPVVKFLLAHPAVSSATGSAWYSGVGGRPVW